MLFVIISVNNNTGSKDSQDPAVPCGRLLHSGCVNRGRRTDLWPPGSTSPCILSWCRGSSDDTGDMCCPESARVILMRHKQTWKMNNSTVMHRSHFLYQGSCLWRDRRRSPALLRWCPPAYGWTHESAASSAWAARHRDPPSPTWETKPAWDQ